MNIIYATHVLLAIVKFRLKIEKKDAFLPSS